MQTDIVIFDPMKTRLAELLEPVKSLQVRDKAENAIAAGMLTTVKGLGKEIEALRTAHTVPLNDRLKVINGLAKEVMAPLDTAEAEIKAKMRGFADAEAKRIREEREEAERIAAAERKRIEDEQKARDEAQRKKEQEERDRIERERLAAEKKAADEKAALAAFGADEDAEQEAERRRVAEENRKKEIAAIEERQKRERLENEARATRERKAAADRAAAEQKRLDAQKVTGTRTVWKYEIVERLEVPMEYWTVDESKLAAAVRGGAREIPGVKIFSEQAVVAGRV